jgi:predicted NAD/FAD-dependent oxidoreductase
MKVAIVGAGVAGLSAAYFLLERFPEAEVVVFEKSKALGGRMATRRISGEIPIDTGCQFLSIDDPELLEFFLAFAPADAIRPLPLPILCLPDGWIVDPESRYCFTQGMTAWSKNLLKELSRHSGFQLKFESPVLSAEELWPQGFDTAFVTAPGPQAMLLGARDAVDYNACLSLVFSWHNPPKEAVEHYAFRDISTRDGITWLAHEGLKRGRSGIWIAQASHEQSIEWRNLPLEELEDTLVKDLAAWIPAFAEGEKTLLDTKFWRHAFPAAGRDITDQRDFEMQESGASEAPRRTYFIGDGYRGVGRVENALESARRAVDDLSGRIGENSVEDLDA